MGSIIHERYVNFYTDFAFKKLFGTEINKELLISFLNSLFEGEEVINDVAYLNAEHMGAGASDRKAVFDVYCENDRGEKILIEMQKAEQEHFIDRSIYYSTFAIQEQAPKGRWDFDLKRVYTIGILNFIFDRKNTDYIHHEALFDTDRKELFYDKLHYYYIEMPKFNKTEDQLETIKDRWLYAIKNLNSLENKPQVLQDAVFQRLFEQAEIAVMTPQEKLDYRESQKNFWDFNNTMETAEKKGRAEGIAEGRAEGIAEGILSVAKTMKANGVDVGYISRMTGLTVEEIDDIEV